MNNIKKIISFVLFSFTVISTVILAVVVDEVVFKIVIIVVGLALSIFLTFIMNYLTKVKEEKSSFVTSNKRCPKCYHPFDGEICFYCGYKKGE